MTSVGRKTVLVCAAPSQTDATVLRVYWVWDQRHWQLESYDPQDHDAAYQAVADWLTAGANIYAVSSPQLTTTVVGWQHLAGDVSSSSLRLCGHGLYRYVRNSLGRGLTNYLLAVQSIKHHNYAPSIGGFRTLSAGERWSHTVAWNLLKRDFNAARTAARAHPAWPAVSQASSMSGVTGSMLDVLARIIDPRDHVNPLKPDRAATLRNLFHATPRMMEAQRQHLTCQDCYRLDPANPAKTLRSLGESFASTYWMGEPLDIVDLIDELPPLLQSRTVDLKLSMPVGKINTPRWWLGGSQLFLRFVRDYWLHENQEADDGYARCLCDLSSYFRDERTRTSWEQHAKTA